MRNVFKYVGAVVFGAVLSLGVQGYAQEGEKVEKPKTAILNEVDTVLIQRSILAQQVANTACQATQQFKDFTTFNAEANAKIQSNHPGFELDWNKMTLVPKKASAAK